MMQRRRFLALATGAGALVARPQPVEWPEPDLQHPTSPLGQRITRIARSIRIVRDITYVRRPERMLQLNVYSPEDGSQRLLPAILSFTVAAWRTENRAFRSDLDHLPLAPTPDLYAPVLVSYGFVVVSADCRLAKEAKFPAQIHDCKCAVKWIRAHAQQFRIDPERIGVMGSSASGHLAALVAVTDPKDGLEDESCYLDHSSRVQAAYCFAGLYDFEFYDQMPGDRTLQSQVRDLLGGSYQQVPEVYRRAGPMQYVTPDDPPFLLMHGLDDRRVPYEQTPRFAAALERAGVLARVIPIKNYKHGPIPGKEPEPSCARMDDEIYHFFQKHLRGKA